MKTYQDLQECGQDENRRMDFIRAAVNVHQSSPVYKQARDAQLYYEHENPTIAHYEHIIYDMQGRAQQDLFAANHKISSGFFTFAVDQLTGYLLGNAKAVMKPGAPFYIWHADSEGYNFRGACIDSGLIIRQCLVWVKNAFVMGRQDFQWKHEPCLYGESEIEEEEEEEEETVPCLYGWKDGHSHYFFKNRRQSTVLNFDKPAKSREHPTMKPVKLFNYQMQCSSKEGENILDLFAGSGTTIIACEQNGRNAYCMEFDPHYIDVIIDRWETFTGEKAVKLN